MQKAAHILLAALIALGAALPASVVLALDPPYWSQNQNDTGLPAAAEDADTLTWDGTTNNTGTLGGLYTCVGSGCATIDVYFKIDIQISFVAGTQFPDRDSIRISWGPNGMQTVEDFICTNEPAYDEVGICYAHLYRKWMADSDRTIHRISYSLEGVIIKSSFTATVKASISGVSLRTTDCDDDWQINSITVGGSNGVIVPETLEEGVILNDESVYGPLTVGDFYKVVVAGGPWDDGDGNDERRDTAIRQGEGGDWVMTESIAASPDAECVQDGEDPNIYEISFVFEAVDEYWAIRVNDLDGQFGDNSHTGLTVFKLYEVSAAGSSPCSDSYMVNGTAIKTGTIPATSSAGVVGWTKNAVGKPSIGDWIGIRFSEHWHNNGAGDALQTAAIKFGVDGIWTLLSEHSSVTCTDTSLDGTGTEITWVYLQVTNSGTPYLRVGDTDANFASNTGSLTFMVYYVIYTPPASGCGLDYVIGDYIGQRSAAASSSTGILYDFVGPEVLDATGNPTDRIFVVETVGTWLNGSTTDLHGGMRLLDQNPDPFEALETYSGAVCVETLDPLGHVRVYFPVDPDSTQYSFRAEDAGSYGDNTGSMTFRYYQAAYLPVDDPPEIDPCAGSYAIGEEVVEFSLNAQNPGYYLNILESGHYYAIQTNSGPWEDDGVESYEIAMAAAFQQPEGFMEVSAFGLCTDYDGEYTLTYFYAQAGYKYYVRVNDGDSNLGNNTGYMGIRVYAATNESNNWETCADAYTLTQMATDPALTIIPGNQANGADLSYIKTGALFALEITGDYFWSDPDVTADYEAEICLNDAGGCSWVPISDAQLESLASCVVLVDADKLLYRMYFTADGGYKLRVHDTDESFAENNGKLTYDLYTAHYSDPNDPDDPDNPDGDDPGAPEPWQASCITACLRPPGLMKQIDISFGDLGVVHFPVPDVAGWVDWAICTMVQYFMWCQEHTDTIDGIGMNISENVEPMATFNVLFDFIEETRAQIEALELTPVAASPFDDIGGTGGVPLSEVESGTVPDPPANPVYMLMPGLDPENNPWFGGPIDLTVSTEVDPEKASTIAFCEEKMTPYVGGGAGGAVCDLHYMVTHTSLFTALISALDVTLLAFLGFRYIPGYIKRWFRLFEGKSDAGSVRGVMGGL